MTHPATRAQRKQCANKAKAQAKAKLLRSLTHEQITGHMTNKQPVTLTFKGKYWE